MGESTTRHFCDVITATKQKAQQISQAFDCELPAVLSEIRVVGDASFELATPAV